jgi:hypothetical protein
MVIGRGNPFYGRLLSRQDEATSTRARELQQPRRGMLATPVLMDRLKRVLAQRGRTL